jgi:hypothetical protein
MHHLQPTFSNPPPQPTTPPKPAEAGPEFCATCTCSLVGTFLPAFETTNLLIDPAYPASAAAKLVVDCTMAYLDA